MNTEVDTDWVVRSIRFTNCRPRGIQPIGHIEFCLDSEVGLNPRRKRNGLGPTLLEAMESLSLPTRIVRSVVADTEGNLTIDTHTPIPARNPRWVLDELLRVLWRYGYELSTAEATFH